MRVIMNNLSKHKYLLEQLIIIHLNRIKYQILNFI